MADRADVDAALLCLAPEHRQVLLQATRVGATVGTVARALGLPPATVKVRVYYALKAFKQMLGE